MKPKKPLGEKIPPKPKVSDFVDGNEEDGDMDMKMRMGRLVMGMIVIEAIPNQAITFVMSH